jgi:Ca2+-binding EF-hand superfamily protein
MEEYSHKTLLNQVNMEKVREIKRAIRRRYANRKNIRKIFNMWDEDSNGVVSVKNVHNMCNKMGFNINIPEATVLLATADQDRSNDLTLDEFLNLIFIDNDAINLKNANLPSELATYTNILFFRDVIARRYF